MRIITTLLLIACTFSVTAKDKSDNKKPYKASTFSALSWRSIGPALTAGRIVDIAVNPNNSSEYYLGVACGGVWKTENAGTTFTPIFDGQGSYSIGCVTIDPNNPSVVWVGTGENNNQRSVAYGDGVYRSLDGGKSWKNMGLKKSEHIGNIVVHPSNSDIVYVSAYGPLWSKGGERGVYKTTDGGTTWKRILHIDENTGINEIHMDPRDPNTLYAAAHQRRRHVFTYIGGGPGSGLHKSTDGGATWKKINKGLPGVDRGRIGVTISPVNPDFIYAIVEAADGKGGFFKSTNRGESWNKQSGYATSGNYYQELIADPKDVDKVFVMDTWLHHTENGGKKVIATGEDQKHVDNHCIWVDPTNTNHWRVGCDGGLYETYDHAKTWEFKYNLPITQFYKVSVDNATPFYNVYGGTQDNNSQGGPSRTTSSAGILNSDWVITNGGDGFESVIDPKEPNIVYAQSQYGWLVRYDKQSGEKVGIKPQPRKDEEGYRWNWDAPLIVSPHNHKRLYFCANKVFKSDDRGDSWQVISDDLTQQIDRNKLKVMDQVWSMDAVMKNKSTTMYGNIVALDESPVQENLLYIGTDDGLIQTTSDNGANWKKLASFPGVPANTYVNAIIASKHDVNVVYAVFNNHKRGDFKPYVMKSIDKGNTWTSISANLPDGAVYDLAEDHLNKNLLFVGTEFGVHTSIDGGKSWTKFSNGLPTIAVRDIEIQERENDLVIATFGRGFYVLDDYSPLRNFVEADMKTSAKLYPVKDGLLYIQGNPFGLTGTASMGASYYSAPNPSVGATFTFLLNDTLRTLKQTRQKMEKALKKVNKPLPFPSIEEITKERDEEKPYLMLTIYDSNNNPIRKIRKDAGTGMKRFTWNFRHSPRVPIRLKPAHVGRYGDPVSGPLALPGKYTVKLEQVFRGEVKTLVEPTAFNVKPLNNNTIDFDAAELLAFSTKIDKMRNAITTGDKVLGDLNNRVNYLRKAVENTPVLPMSMLTDINKMDQEITRLYKKLNGDNVAPSLDQTTQQSISGRVGIVVWFIWDARTTVGQAAKDQYKIAGEEFGPWLVELSKAQAQVEAFESKLAEKRVPYTPGRMKVPDWKME